MSTPGTCQAAPQGAETPEGAEVAGAFVQLVSPQLPKVFGRSPTTEEHLPSKNGKSQPE